MAQVDVVIPCYQYGRFLPECVGSVLGQGIEDLRILIIDNASTDDSPEIARQLAVDHPQVEVITHRTNRGATFSYNEGIDWAGADYFLLLDADDLLAPGALERAVNIMERHAEIAFTHGIEERLDADRSISSFNGNTEEPEWIGMTGQEFIERLCRAPVNSVGANTVIGERRPRSVPDITAPPYRTRTTSRCGCASP